MPDLCVPLTSPGTRSLPAMTARPIPPICDALAVGLCFSEQRFEAGLQVLSDGGVETVIHLAGLDQVVALAPGEIRPSHLLPASAKPAMVSVSRCAEVFLTQSFERPIG